MSRKHGGGGAEGKGGEKKEQPGCSMTMDLLDVILSNSPQHRTAGGWEGGSQTGWRDHGVDEEVVLTWWMG